MGTWKDTLIAAYEEMGDSLFQREVMPEEPTSGLEEIVEWDRLETLLEGGYFYSKQEVKGYIRDEFLLAGENFQEIRSMQRVVAGLFPEHREIYKALPNRAAVQKGA